MTGTATSSSGPVSAATAAVRALSPAWADTVTVHNDQGDYPVVEFTHTIALLGDGSTPQSVRLTSSVEVDRSYRAIDEPPSVAVDLYGIDGSNAYFEAWQLGAVMAALQDLSGCLASDSAG